MGIIAIIAIMGIYISTTKALDSHFIFSEKYVIDSRQ